MFAAWIDGRADFGRRHRPGSRRPAGRRCDPARSGDDRRTGATGAGHDRRDQVLCQPAGFGGLQGTDAASRYPAIGQRHHPAADRRPEHDTAGRRPAALDRDHRAGQRPGPLQPVLPWLRAGFLHGRWAAFAHFQRLRHAAGPRDVRPDRGAARPVRPFRRYRRTGRLGQSGAEARTRQVRGQRLRHGGFLAGLPGRGRCHRPGERVRPGPGARRRGDAGPGHLRRCHRQQEQARAMARSRST